MIFSGELRALQWSERGILLPCQDVFRIRQGGELQVGWSRINNKFLQRVHHFGSESTSSSWFILYYIEECCLFGLWRKKYTFSLYISYISESQLFLSINENTKKLKSGHNQLFCWLFPLPSYKWEENKKQTVLLNNKFFEVHTISQFPQFIPKNSMGK